jgi:predicted deacylase
MSLSKRSVPYALAGLLGAIAIVVMLAGVLPALERRHALAAETAEAVAQAPAVLFVEAVAAPETVRVTLPARMEALQQTALYAQVGGYLGPMRADLGDTVAAGQLLTEIQTPVLDRQIEQNESSRLVAQAKIDLAQAKLDLATATLARLRSVGDARAISRRSCAR